ncbi:MAG: hypothetical protein HY819_10050 [Acidobacteria bacterium]|nr:hypothetical protein [Acidobacteriota bacterium]
MPIKIENFSTIKAPTDLEKLVNQVFDTVPKEHIRGISKVVFVDEIKDPRLASVTKDPQPILYHPKTPANQAFIELAMSFFLAEKENYFKRVAAKLNFKSQIAGALLAIIGQHYHLSHAYGVKKNQMMQFEPQVRAYVEKHFVSWRDQNGGWRVKMFKPFEPYMKRLDKWIKKKMMDSQKGAKKVVKK